MGNIPKSNKSDVTLKVYLCRLDYGQHHLHYISGSRKYLNRFSPITKEGRVLKNELFGRIPCNIDMCNDHCVVCKIHGTGDGIPIQLVTTNEKEGFLKPEKIFSPRLTRLGSFNVINGKCQILLSSN